MKWSIRIQNKASKDLSWLRVNDRKSYLKCFDLVRELILDPRTGTGKPERLKYFDREVWSRRITHENRMIYVVYPEEMSIDIVSCKSHYEGPLFSG